MPRLSGLLAFALVGLPVAAQAQHISSPHRPAPPAVRAPAPATARPSALTTAVGLTRRGTHAALSHTLVQGLDIVDVQRADVDGDGDQDALLLVDVAMGEDEPKDDLGRGVVVAFRSRRGWRAQTVASVPLYPMEAGYNWGRVEPLRAGAPPLLHVLYSEAHAAEHRQARTVLHFARGALREVYTATVESVPGSGEHAISRVLDVQAADVDGDGTSELLERVAASSHCPDTGCFTADGMFAPTVTRRVMRWDPAREAFIEAPSERAYRAGALRLLDDAMARWRAGDFAGRDASIARAYALDPLDARVRLAQARSQLRAGRYADALLTLQFTWPQGFGRDARVLTAEAAAHAGAPDCHAYLASLRNDDPVRGADVAARLAALSPTCRGPLLK